MSPFTRNAPVTRQFTAPQYDLKLRRTALHEAGHAVVGALFGMPITFVSVDLCDLRGVCKFGFRGSWPDQVEDATQAMAGIASVELFAGGRDHPPGVTADERRVEYLLESLRRAGTMESDFDPRKRADEMLRTNGEVVQLVAEALLSAKGDPCILVLDGAKVESIIADHRR